MLDRVTGMQVFVRVAGLGGLSAAARSLAMSPTLVTKHVAALEERLGVKLLYRTTRKVTLTEAGKRYLEGAERILADVEEVEAATGADHADVRGILRANVPVSLGMREIASLMPEFARLHPSLTVELGLNDRVVDLVEEGWDVAIRIGMLQSSTLVARKLGPCRMIVCASPGYLRQHGAPATVAELSRHPCLGYTLSRTMGIDAWAFGRAGDVVVPVTCALRANNGDALVAAAVAGYGITYQPTFLVAEALRSGGLVPLALDHPGIATHDIFAVHPATRRPPAKVRAFIDFLAKSFGPVPPWDRDLNPAG
ncbi:MULTISPECIES: LysR family transcriptional regulator [Inquilinus]|uniref:DNA-binding transcriptional LysR family regulator n=1 Tax=Inquilinus ginsengisoli TaxID=363840 RepID=A0ABU1JNS4_9PROT|nr:LysR family transcriptional regulator [Inquilinus ginsengisoli]MDR6290271.1 DNA-binding transcriptional LysR family regulator [Inquilinus ginsengisoli]